MADWQSGTRDIYQSAIMPTNQMQEMLTLPQMIKSFGSTSVDSKKTARYQAQGSQTGGFGNETIFQFGRDGFADLQTVTMEYLLSVTPDTCSPAGAVCNTYLPYGVGSLIDRITLEFNGGTKIEDVNNYARIKSCLLIHNNTVQWWSSTAQILEGIGYAGTQFFIANSGTYFYQHQPMLGFLYTETLIPLGALPFLIMTVFWAAYKSAFVSNAPPGVTINYNTGSYSISNAVIRYDTIYLKEAAEMVIFTQMAAPGGWKLHFQSFRTATVTGQTGTTIQPAFSLRYASIKFMLFQLSPNAWNSTQYDYYLSQITGFASGQIILNNTEYPNDAVTTKTYAYKLVQQAFGQFGTMYRGGIIHNGGANSMYNLPLVAANATNPRQQAAWGIVDPNHTFIFAYPFDLEDDSRVISGVTTTTEGIDPVMSLTYSGVSGNGADCFMHAFIDCIASITGTKSAAQMMVEN